MKIYTRLLSAIAGLIICFSALAQPIKQDGNMRKLQKAYAALEHPEISFETFLSIEKEREKMRMNGLNKQNVTSAASAVPRGDVCYNGDFESGLSLSDWGGAYGVLSGTTIDFNLLTYAILGGPLSDQNSHQTLVNAGIDPNTGISNVAPGGSANAVRLATV